MRAQHTMLWSGTQWFDGTFNSSIPTGAWSHLVMVVNNGTLNLYLNGALVNTMANFPDVFTPAPSTQFALGVNFWDTPYNGLVDELKFYDEAIALENVQELYGGNPAPERDSPLSKTGELTRRPARLRMTPVAFGMTPVAQITGR